MINLGFSIYPENHDISTSFDYIDLLTRYGAKRVFVSLLQLETGGKSLFQKYQQVISYANDKGLRVIADISPDFVRANHWETNLIEEARSFGLSGLRLDESLSVEEMVALTNNPHGIKIELNSSTEKQLLLELVAKGANISNIMGCHNFYPHRYTGLGREHFYDMSQFYKQYGVESSVFISSNTATEGPWLISEGLPTLEDLRDLPITLQADVYKATQLFDNVIISNQFISEEELKALEEVVNCEEITFKYKQYDISKIEEEILSSRHVYRGDISDYVIRSTQSRLQFANRSIIPRSLQETKSFRGLITIDNDDYTRYKGELQIALNPYNLFSKINVVGHICEEYLILLDYIQPWQSFRLIPDC